MKITKLISLLALAATTALADPIVTPNGVVVLAPDTLDLNGATITTGLVILGGGTIQNGSLFSDNTIELQGGTISANLIGTASVSQNSDTSYLAGENTFTGGVFINNGTLVNGSYASALGALGSSVTINNGTLIAGLQFLNYDFGGSGGQIVITGDSLLGSFTSPNGVNYGGTINVGSNAVGLITPVATTATAGNIILASGGQLSTAYGLFIPPIGSITANGSATVGGSVTSTPVFSFPNGVFHQTSYTVNGPTAPGTSLVFTGQVTGGANLNGNITLLAGGGDARTMVNGNVTFGPTSVNYFNIGGSVAGAQFDQLMVSAGGTLNLNGTLNLTLNGRTPNGLVTGSIFDPAPGESFELVINNGSIAGSFSNVNLSDAILPADLYWSISTDAKGDVFATAVSVPEASTVSIWMGLGVLGVSLVRRNRKKS